VNLPPFNPLVVFWLYLKRKGVVLLKWFLVVLLGVGVLGYGFLVSRHLALRVNLGRKISEPSRFYILALRKKYAGKKPSEVYSEAPPPSRVLCPTGEFLFYLRKYVEEGKGRNPSRLKKLEGFSRENFVRLLARRLIASRYKALEGMGDSGLPGTLSLFMEGFSRRWPVYSPRQSSGAFPCELLNPLPFEFFSLAALSLHVSLIRYVCLGEERQMDYMYDLYQGSRFFFRYLEVEGIRAERRALLGKWGLWRLLIPGERFERLALPLSRGVFLSQDERGRPCPYPYNLYQQYGVLSRYFLTALAFSRTAGRDGEGMGFLAGIMVRVKRSGNLVLVEFPLQGKSLLLVRNSPIQCDSSLSSLLEKVKVPTGR